MSPRRTRLACAAALLALAGCGTGAAPLRIAAATPHTVRFEQTFTLSADSVGGELQNDLRVVQDVVLELVAEPAPGTFDAAVRVGRVRVWVGDLEGPPAVDTAEHGAETLERIYTSDDSGIAALLGALWLPMTETRATARLDAQGRVTAVHEDAAVAARLDGNGAEHLGTALLEGALRDPSLLVVPLGDGDVWRGALRLRAAPWNVALDVPLEVRRRGTRLALRGEPEVPAAVGALRIERVEVAGTADIGLDGLPTSLAWLLEVFAAAPSDDGGAAVVQSARLAHALRRTPIE